MFAFCEEVFPEGLELLILVTELTLYTVNAEFINEHGCDAYFRYNKEFMFYERQTEILSKIKKLSLEDETENPTEN